MPVFVNKWEISDDEVHREMINHPAPTVNMARREAARALVVRRLLLEAAAERGLVTKAEIETPQEQQVEETISQLLDRVITTPDADETTCRRYYHQHKKSFVDKTTDRLLPYRLVKPHIIQYLEDRAFHGAFNAYLDTLMSQAKIVGLTA